MTDTGAFDGSWPIPRSTRAPTSVFHFTNMEGLLKIIESASLRATEVSGLNDPSEVSGGLTRIYEWLRAHRGNADVDAILDIAPDSPEPYEHIFVLSACLDGDDAAQWRAYGDGGRGVAIELDTTNHLTVKAQELVGRRDGYRRLFDSASVSNWARTLYTDSEVDTILTGFASWAGNEIADALRASKAGDDTAGEIVAESVIKALTSIATLIKHRGYHGESEARTVVSLWSSSPHTGFRAGPYGIVQHALLAHNAAAPDARIHFADVGWSLPIRSVRLGPHVNFELARNSVRELLRRHGYVVGGGVPGHVRVLGSDTPMR